MVGILAIIVIAIVLAFVLKAVVHLFVAVLIAGALAIVATLALMSIREKTPPDGPSL